MNIQLRADLDYVFNEGKYKGKTLRYVIDKHPEHIQALRDFNKIKMTVNALCYFIESKNKKLRKYAMFCDQARN